ncbi:MAG: phosphotransferase [Deltaproteobacteria bacterium]|jgi:phosphate uptake regulator/aminoglycoside phosphotransferase (APT) family kinase protein|nr:phosphotransferase [Deltaproteobacteria bacterium]
MLTEIKGGFRILANEVIQATAEARDLLRTRDPKKSRDLYHRSAYINTQVALLQKQSMELFLDKGAGYREALFIQGLSSIASRLERVSDILLNLDRQAGYLSDPVFLKHLKVDDFFHEILDALARVNPALEKRDVSLAIRLGQVEERLDSYYAEKFAQIISELSQPNPKSGDLVTALMIVHYLERIGDMLLEIGEKIIYIIMGEKIKLEQYKALGAGLKATGQRLEIGRMGFKSIWGGKSGCRIGVVGSGESEEETVLFKHGPAFKLTRERENLELWQRLRPGLPPAVKAFIPAEIGSEAALMLEYIPCRNLQSHFLENDPEEAFRGLSLALETMASIWRETLKKVPSRAEFIRQTENRLSEAKFLYPHLLKYHGAIGNLEIAPLPALLARLRDLESQNPAPFSTLIHGDLNLSNILFDPQADRIYALDLYRSRENDYVQDVSVLLVSILRLPVSNPKTRARLTRAAYLAFNFAKKVAASLGDDAYDARLAFGLARSFLTSTRFVLEEKIAAKFVARARYLWEKIDAFRLKGRAMEEFRLPWDILNIPL